MANQQNPTPPHQGKGTTLFTVMVISPDPTQLKLLAMALQLEWTCEVFSCKSVQQAERRITTLTPDLVILEALVLESAALPLAEKLRQCSGRSELPVLVLNAEVATQSEHLLCLTRSWAVPTLYAAIRQLLGLPA